jgi:Mn2+/Fe2+ NRAMP family transporter
MTAHAAIPASHLGKAPSEKFAEQERLDAELLHDTTLPTNNWLGMVRHFGPGIVLMMTGLGTSHIITAPVAGGRFEFALLWCVPVAYIFKYYGFEMAFRFTHATGRSILDAYATSWRKWTLWYVLAVTLLQCAVGQAGRLVAAAAVVYYLFSEVWGWPVPLTGWALLLGVLSVWGVLRGQYLFVERATKVMAGALMASTFGIYFFRPAPLSALGEAFVISTPPGSWLIICAFLGLLPTGVDVSLQASEWGKAKRAGTGRLRAQLEALGLAPIFNSFAPRKSDLSLDMGGLPPKTREYCRRWFRIGMWDFALGHFVSMLIAVVFLVLAAEWLYPSTITGMAVVGEIAGIFTRSVGPGAMALFLVGAFGALFATAFGYFDGWPRVVGACARNLFRPTAQLSGIDKDELTPEHRRHWYSEYNIYRATMFYSLIAAVLIISGVPEPVSLVLIASALAFFIAPIIYFLNLYYCVTIIPKRDSFYPSAPVRWFSWLSLVIFSVMTAIAILGEFFNVALFGA